MEWIKTSEQLPEIGVGVLCSGISKLGDKQPFIRTGEYQGSFWIVGGNFDFDIGEVEYWTPIPVELPEEFKNK